MKRLATFFCIVALTAMSFTVDAWKSHKADTTAAADPTSETVRSVRWEGRTDLDMLKQARSDIESATEKDSKIKTLRVDLSSPGGPALTALDIARVVHAASANGLVVEFHAYMLCASGCAIVLSSGTAGHRYIDKGALFMVHSLQGGTPFGGFVCTEHVDDPKTQDDKVTNVLFDMLRDAYGEYTGQPPAEIEKWLTCGDERIGEGKLAVAMHIADATE